MGKKLVLSGLAMVVAVYVAYPYVTLYALELSVEHGSAAVIEPFVAWDSVREGIKEDVCDDVAEVAADDPAPPAAASQSAASQSAASQSANPQSATPQSAGAVLPPFGSGFVRAIEAKMIDSAVTPDSVGDMLRGLSGASTLHVDWAFFESARSFVLQMSPASAHGDQEPFKLRLDLDGGVWRITRAWLPHWMLERAVAART